MATNPILAELQGLSPGAQAALKMAGQTLSTPPAQATAAPPMAAPKITPQMKTAAPVDAGPPPNLSPMKMPGSDPIPQLGAPPAPNVQLAPQERGTLMGDQAERSRLLQTGAGEDQIAHRIENSGFGQNHHILGSILGNVAQGAAKLGDIGLSTVAPEIAINTPGTEYHHMADLNHANQAVAQDEANAGKEAQTAETNANAGHLNAETPEIAPNAASLRTYQGAETRHANDEADAIEHPKEDWEPVPGFQGPNGEPLEREKASGHYRIADIAGAKPITKPSNLEHVAGIMNGKPTFGNYHADTGVYTDENGQPMHGFQPQPPQTPAGAIVLNPSTAGGYDAQAVRPGSHIAPGAVTVSGMNSMDTPTAQSRNMAEMAKTVLPQMTAISNEVDKMAADIGPGVGRWNQLMVNKGGKDFPQFAKLDTDLDLLASAIVRTHFGARGGQQYREELRKQFGEAQSPEDLKARIAGANSWLAGYAHMADPQAGGADNQNTGGGGQSQSGKSVSLKAAMALPINKGKSEADVRKDIEAHGHTVGQ